MPVFRITKHLSFLALAAGLLTGPAWAAALQAERPTQYHDEKTGLTIVSGEVILEGWHVPVQMDPASPLSQPEAIDNETVDEKGGKKSESYDDDDYADVMTAKRRFRIAALLRDPDASSATLTLYRPMDKSEITLAIDLTEAKKNPGEPEDLGKWAQSRQMRWSWMTKKTLGMIIGVWQTKGEQIYGAEFHPRYSPYDRWSDRDSDMDLGTMALFGGQVAINETLQTQLLGAGRTGENGTRETLPVSSLEGVTVRSHPYAAMAQSMRAAETPASLADYVPADRMMILMHDPERFAGIFDIDSAVLARLTSVTGNSFVDYDLLHRYAARFGATPKQIRTWLSSGIITGAALFTPDVFFFDSTDVTLVIRLSPSAARVFDFGFDLSGVASIPLSDGGAFHAAVQDDLLVVSTNKGELESAIKLIGGKGEGSLGRSDEFRVMTHELPLMADAGIYFYFSDPFIRRLTGPEVKINQLRRAQARAKMQDLTATNLLYRLDHGKDGTLNNMKAKGYLTDEQVTDCAPEANAVVRHKTWGTLDRLGTLLDNPVSDVTTAEAEAYRQYVDRYEDFWREFFDPIAVRLDLSPEGDFSLETFILPLIDNSIYNELKEVLGTTRPEKASMPQYETPPVMSMAFQVRDKSFLDELFRYELRYMRHQVHPFMKGLGTSVVFSIQDDAPIIQTGYPGSALDTFGGGSRFFGMRGEELLLIPVMTALFSRPADLAIEVTDEALVNKALNDLFIMDQEFVGIEHVIRENDGTHVIALNVAGIIRMEFSLRVEQGWLHISNHPWSVVPIVGNRAIASHQAAIELTPSAVKEGLPQTVSLMQSMYRNAVFASAVELLPWMEAFGADPAQAAALQKKALGRATPLPPEVTLETKPFLEAKPYGSVDRQRIPENANDLTAMPSMPDIRLWMRFEGNGLRSRLDFVSAP